MERLIRFLVPYFIVVTPDLEAARAEVLETLASYGARTRSEMLNAIQIIAFGLSALETLGEAKTDEMSPSMRLRFRGCANNLNRSGQKNEQVLARRQARDLPDIVKPVAEPVDDVPEALVEEIIQQTRTKIDTTRNRLSCTRPASGPYAKPASKEQYDKRPWGSAMLQALAGMGIPAQPTT
jgi:hypothetical protein